MIANLIERSSLGSVSVSRGDVVEPTRLDPRLLAAPRLVWPIQVLPQPAQERR